MRERLAEMAGEIRDAYRDCDAVGMYQASQEMTPMLIRAGAVGRATAYRHEGRDYWLASDGQFSGVIVWPADEECPTAPMPAHDRMYSRSEN